MWTAGNGRRSGLCRGCWRRKVQRRNDEREDQSCVWCGGGRDVFVFWRERDAGADAGDSASTSGAGSGREACNTARRKGTRRGLGRESVCTATAADIAAGDDGFERERSSSDAEARDVRR